MAHADTRQFALTLRHIVCTALIPIAAGVLAPFTWAPDFLRQLSPILAAGAMAFSSISVVSNSLRLKRVKLN
ncbi:MAG: hypothetical protein H6668_23030 [Ardenticatenaceae bacterium]|nr:hypothetical protein [Ardenticatenaceae bacterium]